MNFGESCVALLLVFLELSPIFGSEPNIDDKKYNLRRRSAINPYFNIPIKPETKEINDKHYLKWLIDRLHRALANPILFFENDNSNNVQESVNSQKQDMDFLNVLQILMENFKIESAINSPTAVSNFVYSVNQLINSQKLIQSNNKMNSYNNDNPFNSIMGDIGGPVDRIPYDPLGVFGHDNMPGIFKGTPLDPLGEIKNMMKNIPDATTQNTTPLTSTTSKLENKNETTFNYSNIMNSTYNETHFWSGNRTNSTALGKEADWYDDEDPIQTNLYYPAAEDTPSYTEPSGLKERILNVASNVARFARKMVDNISWT